MNYYIYADIHDAKVKVTKFKRIVQQSADDIGLKNCGVECVQGSSSDYRSFSAPNIKKVLFNKSRGFLFLLYSNEKIEEKKLNLLKCTIIMQIMGVIEIKDSSEIKQKK